ncbi:MAG: hypothetical protein D6E12_17340 [Desulfovibrio sp.]|nr:MAG: hypothetical protein D6E12_17340 [Desulfovibrio sp.]
MRPRRSRFPWPSRPQRPFPTPRPETGPPARPYPGAVSVRPWPAPLVAGPGPRPPCPESPGFHRQQARRAMALPRGP